LKPDGAFATYIRLKTDKLLLAAKNLHTKDSTGFNLEEWTYLCGSLRCGEPEAFANSGPEWFNS